MFKPKSGTTSHCVVRAIGMKPQAVSTQLQRLTDKGILGSVRYRVIDSCIVGLLDQGFCLTEDTWTRQDRRAWLAEAA